MFRLSRSVKKAFGMERPDGSFYIGTSSFGDCHLTPRQLIQMNTATGAMPHTFTDIPAVKMVRWSIHIIVSLFYEISWPDKPFTTIYPRDLQEGI